MRRRKSQNLLQLATALEEEWNNIPGHVIQRYVSSVRRRCVAVLNAGGGHKLYWLVKFHSDARVDQKSVLSPCVSKSDFLQKNIVKHWCLVIITKHCSVLLILNKLTKYLCYTFLFLFSILFLAWSIPIGSSCLVYIRVKLTNRSLKKGTIVSNLEEVYLLSSFCTVFVIFDPFMASLCLKFCSCIATWIANFNPSGVFSKDFHFLIL